ncbi:hypothetical protein GFS31_01390 [Leptolyngbya sp. BL0902]|uniref:hypothetical protein n=1 Tax=Leptolyngbya sp. BL0902 TaxID=1115757 RepID=UPI0018E70D93|nr:hypothetical protein [Leptolyngbya sp. BL0902]QQE63474.1 hypothetical protein GFS31_01390 [Leptolyngbya sp. BL0902]
MVAIRAQDRRTTPSPEDAPIIALRLSRDPSDIAYLYSPGRLTNPAVAQPSRSDLSSDLSLDLASQWNDLPSPDEVLRLGNFVSDGSGADQPFSSTRSGLGAYLSAHTTAHTLAQGQLLLRPTATALGTWLWVFAHTCPPPPDPVMAVTVPFPHKQAPLAEALHLSPLALLQYTHMRCHQLAQRTTASLPSFQATDADGAHGLERNGWTALIRTPVGQQVVRELIALVDDLAIGNEAQNSETSAPFPAAFPPSPPPISQGFAKGYRLCVAVDRWWRDPEVSCRDSATAMVLQGVAHGLAHLLQGWLQAPAPTRL